MRAALILCVPAVSAYSYSLIPDMLEHIKYAAYAQIFLSHGLFIFCASTGLYSLVFAGGWLHRKCGRGPTEWLAIRNRQHNILWEKENSDTESPLTYVRSLLAPLSVISLIHRLFLVSYKWDGWDGNHKVVAQASSFLLLILFILLASFIKEYEWASKRKEKRIQFPFVCSPTSRD